MRKLIAIGFFGAACLTGTNAMAHAPRTREVQATIESIDLSKHTLTLGYDHGHGPRQVVWKKNTQFVFDGKPASVNALNQGSHATIFYRSPLVGKPTATKVAWSGH